MQNLMSHAAGDDRRGVKRDDDYQSGGLFQLLGLWLVQVKNTGSTTVEVRM